VGELRQDVEHGRGVFTERPGGRRLVGTWHDGALVAELYEIAVPALEEEAGGAEVQTVFGGHRTKEQADPSIPVVDDNTGELVEGKSIVLFTNGDRYVGSLKGGKKEGWGMYVYADLSAYKGEWVDDCLDGVRHPMPREELPASTQAVRELNEQGEREVRQIKARVAEHESAKQVMPVFDQIQH